MKYTLLPDAEIRYPEPKLTNDVTVARIKRKTKTGVWECGTLRLPNAVQEEEHADEAPYYPLERLSDGEKMVNVPKNRHSGRLSASFRYFLSCSFTSMLPSL